MLQKVVISFFVLCFTGLVVVLSNTKNLKVGFIDKNTVVESTVTFKEKYKKHQLKCLKQKKKLDSIYYLYEKAKTEKLDSLKFVYSKVWLQEDEMLKDIEYYFNSAVKESIWSTLKRDIDLYAKHNDIDLLLDINNVNSIYYLNNKRTDKTADLILYLNQNF